MSHMETSVGNLKSLIKEAIMGGSLYDTIVNAAKALDFRYTATDKRKAKMLTQQERDMAARDGLTLEKMDVDGREFRGAGNTRAKFVNVLSDLRSISQIIGSEGAMAFAVELENAKASHVEDIRARLAVYCDIVLSTRAYCSLFINQLENYYARKNVGEEKLEIARKTCVELGLEFDENKSTRKWAGHD